MDWLKQNWIKIGLGILVLGALYFTNKWSRGAPSAALIDKTSSLSFTEPISITWNAKVLGCLQSCMGYSFQNLDPKAKYPYFQGYDNLLDEKNLYLNDRTFQVKGLWTGMDCAYKNTVFSGQCTPSIDITEMQEFPENPVNWFSEKRANIGGINYMLVEWRTAGNAGANVTFSLWDLASSSKAYSFYADYNFRKDEFYINECDGPEYSGNSATPEIKSFIKNKVMEFWNKEQWPKECLGI